jgi:hypothetical protein
MSHPVSSLPEAWVERIWVTMRATYGATFDRQWQCPENVEPAQHVAELKAVWGKGLAGLQQNPQAISYALEHLPEFPPNLQQFKALCARRPDSTQLSIGHDRPAPDPQRLAALKARLLAQRADLARSTLDRLRHMRDTGQPMSTAQLDFLAQAERGLGAPSVADVGDFRPIPQEALPPGMRSDR